MANIPTSTKLQWCTFISFWGLNVIWRIRKHPLTRLFTPNQKYTHNCNRVQECLPFQRVSEDSCQRSKDCAKGCVHGGICVQFMHSAGWERLWAWLQKKKKSPFWLYWPVLWHHYHNLTFILNWNIKDYRKKNNTGELLKWTIFPKRH